MAMLNMAGYLKIAGVLKKLYDDESLAPEESYEETLDEDTLDIVTRRLADLFEHDSKTFDRQWFYYETGISIPMEEDQNGKRTG